MRKGWFSFLGLSTFLVLVSAQVVLGSPFTNPPTDDPRWVTEFPYQRNILLDFADDPLIPNPQGGINGADYEGYDDPILKMSDFIEMTGAVEWDPATQAVGIFGATGSATGTLTVHLDNWDTPYVKHFYEEILWSLEGSGDIQQEIRFPSPLYDVTDEWTTREEIQPGLFRENTWYEIVPNPLWRKRSSRSPSVPTVVRYISRACTSQRNASPNRPRYSSASSLAGLVLHRRTSGERLAARGVR